MQHRIAGVLFIWSDTRDASRLTDRFSTNIRCRQGFKNADYTMLSTVPIIHEFFQNAALPEVLS